MYIAIMGFGHNPPERNLLAAAEAAILLASKGMGVAVGNLAGTFAAALQSAETAGAASLAIIDDSIAGLPSPEGTKILIFPADQKHEAIAQHSAGGLIVGGGPGTLRLVECFVALGKPLAAISGSSGVVDDGSLPKEVQMFEHVDAAIDFLAQVAE